MTAGREACADRHMILHILPWMTRAVLTLNLQVRDQRNRSKHYCIYLPLFEYGKLFSSYIFRWNYSEVVREYQAI